MNTPCLGLEWLGMCAYDPAQPSPTYFSLGNAIAALVFTIAVQTFFKPIYELRLGVRHLSISRLYVLIFSAVGMTVIAALVPSFPILHGGPWGYPIVYEVLAALLFVVAYGSVAIAVTRPIRVREKQVELFSRYAARMLSEANESDRVDLLPDLQFSLPRLIKLASFIEGRRNVSDFWLFIHREKVWQAQYAVSLLQILSDPHFCNSVVVRAPWTVAKLLTDIADKELHAYSAERLVQELALQAILSDNSIMTREIDYQGFAEAPLLSQALFSEPFIIEYYNPLDNFNFLRDDQINGSVLKRFNKAAVRCYECVIQERQWFHPPQVVFSIKSFYWTAGLEAWRLHDRDAVDVDFSIEFGRAAKNAIALANRLMATQEEHSYNAMFVTEPERFRHDALEPLVEIVFNALCHISKGFTGSDDPFWHVAIETMIEAYNPIGEQPDGLTPFQQRLTLKLLDKLKDNMNGFYPAVCRVLLSTVGPYQGNAVQPNLTAFNILRNVMYRELKRLPDLATGEPEKIQDYLPDTTTFDSDKGTLTHTYARGEQHVTDLNTLEVIDIDLIDEAHRRALTDEEREAAERNIY